jgi:uncharacterized protein YukE
MGFPFTRPSGDPEGLRAAASSLGTAQSKVSTARDRFGSGSSTVQQRWQSPVATRFAEAAGSARGRIDGLVRELDGPAAALRDYAETMQSAQEAFDILQSRWQAQQQTLDGFAEIAHPSPADDDQARRAGQVQGQCEQQMGEALDELHRVEQRVAVAFDDGTTALVPGGGAMSPQRLYTQVTQSWAGIVPSAPTYASAAPVEPDLWEHMLKALQGEVMPPDDGGPIADAAWLAGRGLTVGGTTASWMANVRHGKFAPNGYYPNGTYGYQSWRGAPPYQTAWRGMFDRNWQARPYQSAVRGRWATAGTWVGRAGGVASVGFAGYDQWAADAGRTDLSTSERVGRTGTRAVVAGGAAWGGAFAGAKLGAGAGAAIGSVFPGPGTAVGAVVGGLVGGVVGGVAGSALGNEVADSVVEPVGEFVGEATDTVDGALEDAGDAVTFWD